MFLIPAGQIEIIGTPIVPPLKNSRIQRPIRAILGDNNIAFLGYNLDKTEVKKGETFSVSYYWKCLERVNKDYDIFVHLDGAVTILQDHKPIYGWYPTSKWQKGDILEEEYRITIPAATPPGEYKIYLGMCDPKTGERLEVFQDRRRMWARAAELGKIRVF
jgi:hypothetical protein